MYSTNVLLDGNYTDILISEINYDQGGHYYARTVKTKTVPGKQVHENSQFTLYIVSLRLENGLGERGLKFENRKSTSEYRGKNSKMNS